MEIVFKMQCKCNVCSLQRMLEMTLLEVVDFSSEALKDAVGYKTPGPGCSSSFQMSQFISSSFGREIGAGSGCASGLSGDCVSIHIAALFILCL